MFTRGLTLWCILGWLITFSAYTQVPCEVESAGYDHACMQGVQPIKREVGTNTALRSDTDYEALGGYYQYVTQEFRKVLPPSLDDNVAVVLDPEYARFPYWYVNENLIFNQYTYEYVSSRVLPGPVLGTVELSEGNGFTNAYIQVLSGTTYHLSIWQQTLLSQQQKSLEQLSNNIVQTYEQIYGVITDAQIESANTALTEFQVGISTKLDFVFTYVIGYLWSARDQQNLAPLSFTQLVNLPNLIRYLPEMPADGAILLPTITLYFHLYSRVKAVNDTLQVNTNALDQTLDNAQHPTHANGGIEVFDPVNGKVSPNLLPGYAIGLSLAEIQNALSDKSRVISLSFTVSSDSKRQQTIEAGAYPMQGKVMFSNDQGQAVNLGEIASDGKVTIDVVYQGYIYVPIFRADFSSSSASGWFYSNPIWQASQNCGRAVTGYHFVVPPPFNFSELAQGGDFGTLSGVLIANSPQVTISIQPSSTAQGEIKSMADSLGMGSIRIEGVPLVGRLNQRFHHVSVTLPKEKSSGEPVYFVVTDSQDDDDEKSKPVTVPAEMQMADVLLASILYPGSQEDTVSAKCENEKGTSLAQGYSL
ncbi:MULTISPECIES: hypothetical protein [unclassified Vibrio]|uniref:hypothetical protein n=1 Tax=unclassified Vibrio TaxID=2614977 RepID=UPI00136174AC|nr:MULTISPECIES: hypothetical protein [unclassified Vibrio]NAW56300.1 hypothetical protein [Vibrio sp. V36_P2S2PM302]NAX24503.1 hypothetical protein [Vibrio sp. V38_P2S17PM301]NAX29163.1 hypothetical protein [Vibrio sp. V37_P2S8PM304]